MNNKSVIIFGAGRFGTALAKELFENDMEVAIVDINYDRIQNISNFVTAAIQCDIEDEGSLAELGISNFDVAVVAIGSNLDASILAVLASKDNNVKQVIAKTSSKTHSRILKKLGADRIISPENDSGRDLAKALIGKNILDFIHVSDECSLVEVPAKKSWFNKSIGKLNIRNKYKLNIVGIKRNDKVYITLDASDLILEGDHLIVIGEDKNISKLF